MEGRKKKAQSTLEYILVLTAIVGVIIWAAANIVKPALHNPASSTGVFYDIQRSIDDTSNKIE